MAKVTYEPIGDSPPKETCILGINFKRGETVDVKDEFALNKFIGNPSFEVEGHENVIPKTTEEEDGTDDDVVTYEDMLTALKEADVKPESRKKPDVEAAYAKLKEAA